MSAGIGFTPAAAEQLESLREWWAGNRPAAPSLLDDELERALSRIAGFPGSGAPYRWPAGAGVRRVLLPRVRYHVYYRVRAAAVEVLAVWSAERGHGPPLAGPEGSE